MSTWLLAVAVVAALNPARVAGAVPAVGPARWAVVAIGGLLGAVVLDVLALAGDGVLDALDVSAPTLRIGAGLVAIAVALRDVLGPPPSSEPALAGWGAALVPVAVPLVLRPVLGVLAVSGGVDVGAGPVVVSVVAAVAVAAVVAGLVPADDAGVGGRLRRWGAELAAVVLLAAGAGLTVEGILDV
jgi:small neutral amino acid transporter SnatA (MarC family)